MNLLSSFRLAASAALCAVLVACASAVDPAPTVIRTAPPQNYEKTIANYFAFRVRGNQKNTEISFSPPEPGPCPLDGYLTSTRGWVVPIVRATRTGEATGKETIKITTRQYYFWFLGNTIAGITPRIESCPGVGASLSEDAPPAAPEGGMMTASFATPPPETPRRDAVDKAQPPGRDRPPERAKSAGAEKRATAHEAAKKPATATGKARRGAKKVGKPRGTAKPELKW